MEMLILCSAAQQISAFDMPGIVSSNQVAQFLPICFYFQQHEQSNSIAGPPCSASSRKHHYSQKDYYVACFKIAHTISGTAWPGLDWNLDAFAF